MKRLLCILAFVVSPVGAEMIAGTGQGTTPSSNCNGSQFLQWNGTYQCGTPAGGGGGSSLGVDFNGVSITSPTNQINFVGGPLRVSATGSTSTVTFDNISPSTGIASGVLASGIGLGQQISPSTGIAAGALASNVTLANKVSVSTGLANGTLASSIGLGQQVSASTGIQNGALASGVYLANQVSPSTGIASGALASNVTLANQVSVSSGLANGTLAAAIGLGQQVSASTGIAAGALASNVTLANQVSPSSGIANGVLPSGVIASSLAVASLGNTFTSPTGSTMTYGVWVGSLTVNGVGGGSITINGSSAGGLTQNVPGTVTTYSITWPAAQGAANTVPQNNGSGTLSWIIVSSIAVNAAYASGIGSGVLPSNVIASSVATTAAIINQSTLQNGATAYPDFAYVGTSATFYGPFTISGSTGSAFIFIISTNQVSGTKLVAVSSTPAVNNSDAILAVQSSSGTNLFLFQQNSHLVSSGTTPTIGTCGTSPSMGSNSTDFAGTIVAGTGSPTTCAFTFSSAFANTPTCVISDNNTTVTADISTISTTGLTVSLSAGISSINIYYICVGQKG